VTDGKNIPQIGIKSGLIKKVLNIRDNTKSNPENYVIAEGLWALEKAFENGLNPHFFLYCPELTRSPESQICAQKAVSLSRNAYQVSERAFRSLSERDQPDGLLGLVPLPRLRLEDLSPASKALYAVTDGVEIPGNIGTILRSIDGAGGNGFIVTNRRARLTHPKVLKASLGSLFSVPVVETDVPNAAAWLQEQGVTLYLLDSEAEAVIFEARFPDRTAFILGSERYGISKEWYAFPHQTVSIPMYGRCDSLNVAIAASLALYQAAFQQRKRPVIQTSPKLARGRKSVRIDHEQDGIIDEIIQ